MAFNFKETGTAETINSFDFPDGTVTAFESETHGVIRCDEEQTAPQAGGPKLVIVEAAQRAKNFISKTREDFRELNSLLQELSMPLPKKD